MNGHADEVIEFGSADRPMEVTVVRFHPNGNRSTRMWTVTEAEADQVAELLGEPAMYQLTTGEERGTDG